jgi:hypothetical protein
MAVMRSGWVYLVDVHPGDLGDDLGASNSIVLPPGMKFSAGKGKEVPASVTAGFQPTYLRELEALFQQAVSRPYPPDYYIGDPRASLRQSMFGEDEQGRLAWYTPIPVHGPNGLVYILTVRFNDDLDGRDDTARSYLLDAQGGVLERWNPLPPILAVGDLDGDGVDELLTELGPIYWNGQDWVVPQGEPRYRGC